GTDFGQAGQQGFGLGFGQGINYGPQAIALPPMFSAQAPFEEMVAAKMGEKVFEKFSFNELEAMCPDEEKIVETVYSYAQSVMQEQDFCQSIEEGLMRCNESKGYCEKIGPTIGPGMVGGQAGGETKMACPPDESALVSQCKARFEKEEADRQTSMTEDIPITCELEWERNAGNYARMCDNYKQSKEFESQRQQQMPKQDFYTQCPDSRFLDESKRKCYERNGQPNPVYKGNCLVDIECKESRASTGCPAIEASSILYMH
ncbi:hypothetical protein HZB89_00130, partial [archaeon]|nr:hypothetical protein [archaeon]